MAQTGFTPIQLYSTSTAAAAPAAGNLTNSTLGSELAINITDGKLFYKDNANAVQVIGWKTTPTTAGGTGLTTYTAGDLSYYASGTTFTKLAIGTIGQILTSTGSAPQWSTLSGVAVTTFSAGTTGFTPNSATSGAVTLAGTLATTNGGTGLTAFTANQVFYASSTSAIGQSANLTFNGTTLTANTIGAFTLSGTIAGGGNQINNVIIGTSTPLAGFFTTLSATGVATFSAGTVSAPAITTTGDTNTGIFFPAADTIAFTEGGTESMRIFSSGGVSVGNTTDPGATNLSVTGSVNSINTFGYKNRLINGSMVIAARGGSGTIPNSNTVPTSSTGYITVDRWFMYATGAALSVSQSSIASGGIMPFQTVITGAASNTGVGIGQRVENVNCLDLINKTCTLSAYISANGPTSVTWTVSYANTANTFGTIASPSKTQIATGTFTVTGTSTRYNAQISVPANAFTGIEVLFTLASLTSGQNFAITGVQFEVGSQLTSFDYRNNQQEWNLCQRYYESGSYRWRGTDAGLTDVITNPFRVVKYASPTVSVATADIGTTYFTIAQSGAPYDTGVTGWNAVSEIA